MCLSLPSPFPCCSALHDNVVVNRVYSELALGWTSKPPWTLSCSLGFIRAGLVAVLCKYFVLSFSAGIGKYKQHFSPLPPPLPLSTWNLSRVLTEASPLWLSRCVLLPCFCETSQANSMSALFFKNVQSLRMRGVVFFFSFFLSPLFSHVVVLPANS